MESMKGFIHLVEVVIVAILIFITLSQFFYFPAKTTYWDQFSLERLSRDTLLTLSKTQNISVFLDSSKLQPTITSLVSINISTIGFSVSTEGFVPPTIKIACVCSETEQADITNLLHPLVFNNRTVRFDITHHLNNVSEINNFTDVDIVLLYRYHDISPDDTNTIIDFLRSGKGIIELSDLTGITIDSNHQALFSIKNTASTIQSGAAELNFYNTANKKLSNYKIWEYYSHIPLYVKTNFDEAASLCTAAAGKNGTLILKTISRKTLTCINNQIFIDIDRDGTYNNDPLVLEGPFNKSNNVTIDNQNYIVSYIDNAAEFYTLNMPDNYSLPNYINPAFNINATKSEYVVLALNKTYCNPGCGQGAVPGLVANDKIFISDLHGRSVWIQNSSGTDWEHLFKTSIAWVAGSKYQTVPPINIKPGAIGSEYYINYYGDLFEPGKVILTMWYVF